MEIVGKQLSSPFATGGGGVRFEAHIQANFVTLMLSGGYAPCLPCWPIVEINLQGKVDGYETDDLVVFVESPSDGERRKLLCQVKHSISVTKGNTTFAEVIQAAWLDFNNETLFRKGKDLIALVTGPLSSTDISGLGYLIEQALHVKEYEEFFLHVNQSKFSSDNARKKLSVLQGHLDAANNGQSVSNEMLYKFLRHFRLLGYDLDRRTGVISSLLQSHIAQFNCDIPDAIWAQILKAVQDFNQQAGTIVRKNLPQSVLDYFKPRAITVMPEEYAPRPSKPEAEVNWNSHAHAATLAQACLLGSWNEKSEADLAQISIFVESDYKEWVKPLRIILQSDKSPLKFKNGIWSIHDPAHIWSEMGGLVFDQHLDSLMYLASEVLSEHDPAFDLPPEQRYAASLHGKVLKHSPSLRDGVSETVAFIANNKKLFAYCTSGKIDNTVHLLVSSLLEEADWILWASLNRLLPTLSEIAPKAFLTAVEQAVNAEHCPFVNLFDQEDSGIFGANYMSGLLWALELLAWDQDYLIRVCAVLGEISEHDPGGNYANRPLNSLIEILLPWLPQTVAEVELRKISISLICRKYPDVGWSLLLALLPNQHSTSSGTYRPKWRGTIPSDWKESVKMSEYWDLIRFCADLAVKNSASSIEKQAKLVSIFDCIPAPASDWFLNMIRIRHLITCDEQEYFLIWDKLVEFVSHHKRYPQADWSWTDEQLTPLEEAIAALTPTSPLLRYNRLFSAWNADLIDITGDQEYENHQLLAQRTAAVHEILEFGGFDAVLGFIKSVKQPQEVGIALANTKDFDGVLLPEYLSASDQSLCSFISAYACARLTNESWNWFDHLATRFANDGQKARLLSVLPFCNDAWERAALLSESAQNEYWSSVRTESSKVGEQLEPAIHQLVRFGRPMAAIDCLNTSIYRKQAVNVDLACDTLLQAADSAEPSNCLSEYSIVEVIKYLQQLPDTDQKKLFMVEWTYLSVLDGSGDASPKLLEQALANDADFYCSLIKMIYLPKGQEEQEKPTEEIKRRAENAYRLLDCWAVVPGLQADGSFDGDAFNKWLSVVEAATRKSGHFDIAMLKFGEILYNSPQSPDGFWIEYAIARALDESKHEKLRRGFLVGVRNSRGVRCVDPSGAPEKALAQEFRDRAQLTERKGYPMLAGTLRDVADEYDREAQWIIDDDRWS